MAIDPGIGRTKAYIDFVNMENEIKTLVKTLLPGLVGLGVNIQLLLAFSMVWFSQGTLRPPTMQEEEAARLYVGLLYQSHEGQPRISTLERMSTRSFITDLRNAENGNTGDGSSGVTADQDVTDQEQQQEMDGSSSLAVDNQDIPLLPFQKRPRRRNTEKG